MTPERFAEIRAKGNAATEAGSCKFLGKMIVELADEVERLQARNAALVALVRMMAVTIKDSETPDALSSGLAHFRDEIARLCGEE